MSDLIDVVRALRVELEQSYRRDARSREDVVAAACKAAEAEAELDRVDEALREAGIEYPLGARGVADLRSMAVGRLDELQQAHQRIADLERERDTLASTLAETRAKVLEVLDVGLRERAELERALKVVRAAEAWHDADSIDDVNRAHHGLIAAVDTHREGRDAGGRS